MTRTLRLRLGLLSFACLGLSTLYSCSGTSRAGGSDSAQRDSSALSIASTPDSLHADSALLHQLYNSPLLDRHVGRDKKAELQAYCSDRLLDELAKTYQEIGVMDSDPDEGYYTEVFTSGDINGYDGPEANRHVQLLDIKPLGGRRYSIRYLHAGGEHQTELELISDSQGAPRVDRILRRAW